MFLCITHKAQPPMRLRKKPDDDVCRTNATVGWPVKTLRLRLILGCLWHCYHRRRDDAV
jgi:hypothetical protein